MFSKKENKDEQLIGARLGVESKCLKKFVFLENHQRQTWNIFENWHNLHTVRLNPSAFFLFSTRTWQTFILEAHIWWLRVRLMERNHHKSIAREFTASSVHVRGVKRIPALERDFTLNHQRSHVSKWKLQANLVGRIFVFHGSNKFTAQGTKRKWIGGWTKTKKNKAGWGRWITLLRAVMVQ